MMRNREGVVVEVTTFDGGPVIAVEVTRGEDGWVIGEAKQIGMVMY